MSHLDSIFTYNTKTMNENTPEQQVALVKALIAFVSETKDIHADSTNPFHKSRYASLSAHLNELKPIAIKHGLAIIQMPIGDMEAVGIRNIIMHKDGGMISTNAFIPAEKGIKGQDVGGLISYLRRYSLASIAGIATDDDDAESDRETKSAPKKEYVKLNTSPSSNGTKYIPSPSSKANASEAVAPFGDSKGTPLSQLPLRSEDKSKKCADLNYWANVWEPRPFGDSGKISAKDLATKAEAKRLWESANGSTNEENTNDEVPF